MAADEISDIARGDPIMASVLRESLKRLATGASGPLLREMATEVLEGRVSLREAVRSPHYAEAMSGRVNEFAQQFSQLSEEERQALGQQVEEQITRMREQLK
jgi:hypothetical protein